MWGTWNLLGFNNKASLISCTKNSLRRKKSCSRLQDTCSHKCKKPYWANWQLFCLSIITSQSTIWCPITAGEGAKIFPACHFSQIQKPGLPSVLCQMKHHERGVLIRHVRTQFLIWLFWHLDLTNEKWILVLIKWDSWKWSCRSDCGLPSQAEYSTV